MKRIAQCGLLAVLLGGLGVVGSGCQPGEASLFIRQVQAIQEDCSVTSEAAALRLSNGFIDSAFRAEYVAHLLVGNQLIAQADADLIRVETMRVRIYAVDVQVLDETGGLITEFSVPANGFIDPAAGTEVSYGLVRAVLVDAATVKALGDASALDRIPRNVIASVIARGRTLGGTEIESAEFLFPITICHGCLVDCTTVEDSNSCTDPDEQTADTSVVNRCIPGQDAANVSCNSCVLAYGKKAEFCYCAG